MFCFCFQMMKLLLPSLLILFFVSTLNCDVVPGSIISGNVINAGCGAKGWKSGYYYQPPPFAQV